MEPSARPDFGGADLSGSDLRGRDLSRADLRAADLSGANLTRANLNGANLSDANLSDANLIGADLFGADLSDANLSGANLGETDLCEADLSDANLIGADLFGANLSEADLSEADLSGADLSRAALINADLSGANLSGADLFGANLIDATLNRANLTDSHLWETQRGGWSIKDVICQRAFWDRRGEVPTDYGEGEFERIFAEKPRIELRYPGGMSPIDLLALPIVVERLQADYPDSVLQVRSVQNDAGGASVTITVEDLAGRSPETFEAEMEIIRGKLLTTQNRLCDEEKLRLSFQAQVQVLVENVIPTLAAAPKQQINIGQLSTPMEGIIMNKGDTYSISGQAGAVGPGARAHDNTFQQIQGGIDLPKLAEELRRLRAAMKGEATGTLEQDKAIGAVAASEEAAAKGNGSAALRYLKGAGTWALEIAEKIGVPVAIEFLKRPT